MDAPAIFNLAAYLRGTQPLWRAFWLWFVCGSGSIAFGYGWVENFLADYTGDDSWRPLIRCLTVWSILGITSLVVVFRCSRNTASPLAGMAAFTATGIPTVFCVFFRLWFMA